MSDDETRYMMITMAIPETVRCVCGELHTIEPEDLQWAALAMTNKHCHKCNDAPIFQISILPQAGESETTKH